METKKKKKKEVWPEIWEFNVREKKEKVIVGRSRLAKAGSFLLIKTNREWEGSAGAEGRGSLGRGIL